MKKPLLLCILDGFGWVPDQTYGNAILAARTPNLDKLFAQYPYTTIGASGMNVGLPDGQMGNSEVGHQYRRGPHRVSGAHPHHQRHPGRRLF